MPTDSSDRFIATEPAGARGEAGEKKVWDAVRAAFMPRPESFGFWHYPVFSKAGQKFKEPDFLVVDREFGLTIIEVKSVDIGYIESIQGYVWKYGDPKRPKGNPFEQARRQLQALLDHCDSQRRLVRNVPGRVLVGLPLITEREWRERGFHLLPSCPPIIFKDDLAAEARFISRARNAHMVAYAPALDDERWALLGHVIAGTSVFKKEPREANARPDSRRTAIAAVQEDFYALDLQQLRIGTEIPPGAQRVRGIAGSGKTVLLCQKAAHMHLKHPEWDIAVVFFTRSLYDQIIRTLDSWLRHFSGDKVRFDPATSKLKVLHAWGGKSQAGFYETLCRRHGQKPKVVDRKDDALKPNERLAAACAELMEAAEIEPCFDAVLIDEAQDMVVDEIFKRDGSQPIFWLAYRALRECDPDRPEQRRLTLGLRRGAEPRRAQHPHRTRALGRGAGRAGDRAARRRRQEERGHAEVLPHAGADPDRRARHRHGAAQARGDALRHHDEGGVGGHRLRGDRQLQPAGAGGHPAAPARELSQQDAGSVGRAGHQVQHI